MDFLATIPGAVAQGFLWAVMALGVYLTYRILDIADLTVEGSITTGAAIAVKWIVDGGNPFVALLLAFGGGMLAGLATGLLHTKLKIPALLSGILTMIALYSVNLRIMGTANISINPRKWDTIYSGVQNLHLIEDESLNKNVAVILVTAVIVLVVIGILYWFFGTELGSAIRATGNNPNMVRAQGINTNRMTIIGLVLSNGLVSLSGAMIAQQQLYADVQMGIGAIVIGLASVIIGELFFGKGKFFTRLLSIVIGASLYRIIIAFVLKVGLPANDLKLFTAISIAIAFALPMLRSYLMTFVKSAQKEAN